MKSRRDNEDLVPIVHTWVLYILSSKKCLTFALTRSATNAFYFNFLEIIDVTPESLLKRIKFIGT